MALLAAALMAVSFWPIMYARFGVRHIGTLPWMLAAFYLLTPSPCEGEGWGEGWGKGRVMLAGVCLAAGLMTYFAGRAVPIVLIGFLAYLLIFHRSILKRVWWRYALASVIAVAIAAPMFIEIARTPGAEKRTEVVGGPLIELRNGNLQPAIETTLGTLGMFTFAGDPESLYNVPGRPVFDWITGAFFYLGVLVCLVRVKRVESGFALAWLFVGIAPAFVSVPAASFSHTIAALPVVYVVAAYGVIWVSDRMTRWQDDRMTRWQDDKMNRRNQIILSSLHLVIVSVVIGLSATLTLRDYFGAWANDPFVRFQYHAPTRAIAKWLDQNPPITEVAIGTHVTQLTLDPIALDLDMKRDNITARWFNAETALLYHNAQPIVISTMQSPGDEIRQLLASNGQLQGKHPSFDVYTYAPFIGVFPPKGGKFDHGRLILRAVQQPPDTIAPGEPLAWRTHWIVDRPLDQPRLKMFLHVLNDQDEIVAGDDRADFNFATLKPGDAFIQISRVMLPADLPVGRYPVEVGWYNPVTGERLKLDDGSDRFLLDPIEVIAP